LGSKVDLVNGCACTPRSKLVNPLSILCNQFFSLSSLLLRDLSSQVALSFLASAANELFLLGFEIDDGRWTIGLNPLVNILPLYVDAVNQNRSCATFLNQRGEVLDYLAERKLFSFFGAHQLLLD
jgi:hypothetical protein